MPSLSELASRWVVLVGLCLLPAVVLGAMAALDVGSWLGRFARLSGVALALYGVGFGLLLALQTLDPFACESDAPMCRPGANWVLSGLILAPALFGLVFLARWSSRIPRPVTFGRSLTPPR